jgi:macrolide-specific efflux system membrane fusion protein
VGIVAFGYAVWTQIPAGRFAANRGIAVKVATAKRVITPVVIEAAGQLQASRETSAVSALPGVLKEVRVKVGDVVKKGDVLALLQAKDWLERASANEAAVKDAAAKLNEVKTQLENAEEKLVTTRELYRKDLIARREVEEKETLAEMARVEQERANAELAQREAALAQTRYLLSLTKITAPAGGIVARRFAEPGAYIAASAAIVSIAEPRIMRVTIRLASGQQRLVHAGVTLGVRLADLPGKIYTGTVSDVRAAAERDEEETEAVIDIANPDGVLKLGMQASVSIPLGATERELVVVPRAAIIDFQGKPCVYVTDGRRARLRSVATVGDAPGETVVVSNLTEGEKVITAAEGKLQPESYVRIRDGSRP